MKSALAETLVALFGLVGFIASLFVRKRGHH